MINYLAYIGLFLILYPLLKKGFEELAYDIIIGITYIIANIIRIYFKIKKWIRR